MPSLTRSDDVYLLDLGAGENRFHPDWIAAMNAALDEVESSKDPRSLVTYASGKFYSNGLDLDWLGSNLEQHRTYVDSVERLYARWLSLPLISVAAIGGHAFAAGAMLTLAHDFRVMRADRGFWCLPEVDIDIPFTPGMASLVQSRLTPQVAHEAMLTGRRYGGEDAQRVGIVDAAEQQELVLKAAVELATVHRSKAGATLGAIKAEMYQATLAALDPGV